VTHADRILRYLRDHPGSTTWEIGVDLHIANVTARLSDLRDAGHNVIRWKDDTGLNRYRVAEVTTGEAVPLWDVAS